MTDTELLDALEATTRQGACPAILFDDNGHWAVATDSIGTVPPADAVSDMMTTIWVPASAWRSTLREAIRCYIEQENRGDLNG